jgi:hypothetical protein
MFEKLAKFRIHPSRRTAPHVGPSVPANDNRPHVRDSGTGRVRRPRLVCRWSVIEGTGRLACHWEIESSDEPDRSSSCFGRGSIKGFHKTFFQLSYQPSLGRQPGGLADRLQPVGKPGVSSLGLPVLHAGHSRLPSTVDTTIGSCSCEPFSIGLDDVSSQRFSYWVG